MRSPLLFLLLAACADPAPVDPDAVADDPRAGCMPVERCPRDARPLDAGPSDAGPADSSAPGADAAAVDGALSRDAAPTDAARAADARPPSADAAPMPPDRGPVAVDCAPLAAAGHSVCGDTPAGCEIVFYDGSGCAAACASAGFECLASQRDDDDDAPRCAPHPSNETYDCAETGHQSDFCLCGPGQPRQRAFEGAEGFGAFAEGGRGGRVYTVRTLDDAGEGSLRWAVERPGRRIVQFDVDGVIRLRSALQITDPFITIDGRGALDPGEEGITIRDYPVDIRTHDVIIRYLKIRLGDWAVLRRNDQANIDRPRNSNDLDCVNIHQSNDVILDHLSMSWSADEIVSVTNSRNITVQWSILSEPLGRRQLHPYGDNHAYCANNSAATMTYHHNLFAHYRFRGPQFEANDMQDSRPPFDAKFEAVNNVMYGYTSNGSRYRTGFERAADRTGAVDFSYHFIGNRYVNADARRSEIEADSRYGAEDNIRVHVRGNIGPHRARDDQDELALVFINGGDNIRRDRDSLAQYSDAPLFQSPAPVQVQSAQAAHDAVLAEAGCSLQRDAIDRRIVDDVRRVRPADIQSSQEDVGGWPTYR